MLKVYYSTSVRGALANSKQNVRNQIDILNKHSAKVYNDHLGSDDPVVLDMGHTDDTDIFNADMKYIENSDVMVADITNPSLGVGFMIGHAVSIEKRVLCLYDSTMCSKVSAMIAGNKRIVVKSYNDMISCEQHIIKFLNPLRIILCGKPGSGKGTVGEKLSAEFGLPHISTGDICRSIVSDPSHPLQAQLKSYVEQGQLVPASLMCETVKDRLNQSDCISNGFILDGYPPSQEDMDCLNSCGIKFSYVLYFECSDEIAISRQMLRGQNAGHSARPTDLDESKAKKRVDIFNSKMNFQFVSENWFPHVPTVMINAELASEQVYAKILRTVKLNYEVPTKSTYFVEPYSDDMVNSTKFHFHIDAPDYFKLFQIIREVHEQYSKARNQVKIYPIEDLHLCCQIQDNKMKNIYANMPNFHEIYESSSEAFVTGKIGEQFDCNFMDVVIDVCSKHSCMTELEEYVCEGVLNSTSSLSTTRFNVQPLNWTPKYQSLKNPKLELHHAFNINKKFPKLDLDVLSNYLKVNGFNIGGLFIFKNSEHWAYRTNEFCDDLTIDETINMLENQAIRLKRILSQFGCPDNIEISYSLEIVHGIWTF